LIQRGQLKEEERRKFPNNSIIGLSSACYKFEDLYKDIYLKYIELLNDPKAEDVSHLIFKLSYEAVEGNGRLEMKLINEGRRTSSRAQFDREY
ncbi:hypothetical protein, partial [Streptococcus pneumoniae]|uniref:hypothetical protein n=1 Tax=Streptococcus pneumoniae TaxID=1313 RepID=UPI0018B09552